MSSCGGEVLQTKEHITEWYSYRYVTRRIAPPPAAPPRGPDDADDGLASSAFCNAAAPVRGWG